MKVKNLAVAAVMTATAVGVVSGTAQAQPTQFWRADAPISAPADTALRTQDHGVSIATVPNADGSGVVTEIDSGRFELSPDVRSVTLFDRNGEIVDTLPMAIQVAGVKYLLAPGIEQAGRSLTLSPVAMPTLSPAQRADLPINFADAAADLNRHQYNAGVGALIGLGIGILVGLPFLFPFGAIPGGVIGAAIGALIGWVLP
ncbi:hypothetical protein AB0N05_21050 [Nocardia sp. NPDC051030]|uniref:hypothetical protein n=1 Tax=Nocardia sp. NPDC051030 TaxID=3155162 RepID=UPI00343EEA2D